MIKKILGWSIIVMLFLGIAYGGPLLKGMSGKEAFVVGSLILVLTGILGGLVWLAVGLLEDG